MRKSMALVNWIMLLAILICLLVWMMAVVRYVYADMNLTKAVIHHTASHDVGVKEIDKWHKERGWDGIGYHFVIRADGTVEEGRSLAKRGAHAKGRNRYIGIALTGYEEFTLQQVKSLISLLDSLGIRHIERHHEQCPGNSLDIEKLGLK